MPNPIGTIDVHCHFFNAVFYATEWVEYRKWRISRMIPRDFAGESTIWPDDGTERDDPESPAALAEFAAWLAGLIRVGLADEEGNWRREADGYAASALAPRGRLVVAPLMMDIFYRWENNRHLQQNAPKPGMIPRDAAAENDLTESLVQRLKRSLADALEKLDAEVPPPSEHEGGEDSDRADPGSADARGADAKSRDLQPDRTLDAFMEAVRGALMAAGPETASSDGGSPVPRDFTPDGTAQGASSSYPAETFLSKGFMDQLATLSALAGRYPDTVFPFLAVDPRRPGIVALMKQLVDEGRGVFRGVKLYPPLGYLPTHPNLKEVYRYCSQFDIPITVHCSTGGLESWPGSVLVESWELDKPFVQSFGHGNPSPSAFFANPANWVPVLMEFPNLRINLGHFGGCAPGDLTRINLPWAEQILELMKHPHVYADLSYVAEPARLNQALQMMTAHDVLKSRLMFGTDFVMIAMDRKLGGIRRYFGQFAGLADALLADNARHFLKLT